MIGKPYSGKPNVRFDEGELEIEPFGLLRQLSTLLLYVDGMFYILFNSACTFRVESRSIRRTIFPLIEANTAS
jgi:hypothetical protein